MPIRVDGAGEVWIDTNILQCSHAPEPQHRPLASTATVTSAIGGTCTVSHLAGFQHRQRNIRHAVLRIGRDLAVPMDDGIDIQRIGQIDPKSLSGIERQTDAAFSIDQSPDSRGPPVDVKSAAGRTQHQRRVGCRPSAARQAKACCRQGGGGDETGACQGRDPDAFLKP